MFLVRSSVNFVQNRPILVAKAETRHALVVQRDGYHQRGAPSVNLARLELLATSKVNHAKTVPKITIVRVRRAMVSPLQIQQRVPNVPQVGPRSQAVLNAKHVALERMVMVVGTVSWVMQEMAPIPIRPSVGSAS